MSIGEPSLIRRYIAIGLLMAVAGFVHGDLIWKLISTFLHRDSLPAAPFALSVASRTISSGEFAGDQLLALGGTPLNAARQLAEAVAARHPGDTLRVTLSRPDGSATEIDAVIPSQRRSLSSPTQIALAIALRLVVPLVALALGFGVILIRPGDKNAWLVLLMMLGFVSTVHPPEHEGTIPDLTLLWTAFWNTAWPTALMLFGIYFPIRSVRDRRWPWIKYIFVFFFNLVGIGYWAVYIIWQHDINAAAPLRNLALRMYFFQMVAWLLATLGFWANFRRKSAAETSPDGRRRLSILRFGSWLGLGPVGALAVYAIASGSFLFAGIPAPLFVTALLVLPLFPLTLVYVIVVERAMDLRFAIRMGVKYTLARFGLWTIRAAVLSLAGAIFVSSWRSGMTSSRAMGLAGVTGALLLTRKPLAERASQWVDRKFFREAYDSERVLAGLAGEVGRYLEVKPLLERVAVRIGETLHVSEIVILLREGDMFRTAYSTRAGEPMDIPADSRIVANLEKRAEPLPIYFDKPPLWIRSLSTQELQTLDFMRTQLLLPVMGREGLSGIISLGPKLSEVPYSETDSRLLQAVAWQAGMSLENSRLLASLAKEAALRERINYELEIAREVQERLFPQSYPRVPRLEYRGFCRPAQGIGGDYYDFLQLPGGKLGIAIGDVSGKGIAAALLMASLQASLRAQAISGAENLAVLMGNLNRLVFDASTASRYATFFYGEFDTSARTLSYVNAGHNPPILLRGEAVIRLDTGGPVIGLLPRAAYEQGECPMFPEDILILFTDGITEAMTEEDEEWGEERLIAAARRHSSLEPAQMIQAIFHAADTHTRTATQHDDMTLLIVKVKAGPKSA